MGILNKILFWRHDDEVDFDRLADDQLKRSPHSDLGLDQDNLGFDEKPLFPETESAKPAMLRESPYRQTMQPQMISSTDKELELISSKLDTIKAMLASLDQRTANLERAAGVQQKRDRLW